MPKPPIPPEILDHMRAELGSRLKTAQEVAAKCAKSVSLGPANDYDIEQLTHLVEHAKAALGFALAIRILVKE